MYIMYVCVYACVCYMYVCVCVCGLRVYDCMVDWNRFEIGE